MTTWMMKTRKKRTKTRSWSLPRCLHLTISSVTFSIVSFFTAPPTWSAQLFRAGARSDISTAHYVHHCLAGGGEDELWLSGWQKLLSSTAGGDVVIIRADGHRGGYDEWITNPRLNNSRLPAVHSATTVVLESRKDSFDPHVLRFIQNAELVFFAGGDQSDYVRLIEKSPLQESLLWLLNEKRISFAGTSAGMAILGGIDYRARFGSPTNPNSNLTSLDVLQNPLADFVDLGEYVLSLPGLEMIVTETHFSQRNREGRLVGFIAKALAQNRSLEIGLIHGLGLDEGTALCWNQDEMAKVHGTGQAFFLSPITEPERLTLNHPLTWDHNQKAIAVDIKTSKDPAFRFSDLTTNRQNQEFWSVILSWDNTPVLMRSKAP